MQKTPGTFATSRRLIFGTSILGRMQVPMPEIQSRVAPVRPKAVAETSGETLFLEDLIEPYLRRGEPGPLCVYGPTGTGKSTALAHLAAALPRGSVVAILDDPRAEDVAELADRMLVIYSAPIPLSIEHRAKFQLARWGEDDCLEYLLAVHKTRCASVMARVKAAPGRRPDCPGLWTACLDEMAAGNTVRDFRTALRRYVDRKLSRRTRKRARSLCLDMLFGKGLGLSVLRGPPGCLGLLVGRAVPEDTSILCFQDIQIILAAEAVVDDLNRGGEGVCLWKRLGPRFVNEIGLLAATERKALARLKVLAADPGLQPMAASILHASSTGWKPDGAGPQRLQGGYFRRADWSGLKLSEACLLAADLARATLSTTHLEFARLAGADLSGVRLEGAFLRHAKLEGADLSGADLNHVWAEWADFSRADLREANLEYAVLRDARLESARLGGACFRQADLRGAVLLGADLEGADFMEADLERCQLSGLKLAEADFSGARFRRAHLVEANMEHMSLPWGIFDGADLTGALLTGTSMPKASFRGARLCAAGLGDVEWEGADLRGADLRGATFHMGSSRSGLVFGEPMQGSRTGFYTDEFHEQLYRAPEEIRKANLCGADLRGANLTDVDFYLVDLRRARYDSAQEAHLRRCGAILEVVR